MTRVHGICSLRVMGSWPGILFPSPYNYFFSEKPFVLLIFPTSLSFRLGTVIHTLPSSHLSNLRIDVVASKGDFVVTYEEKTLIQWDMNAGVQKATFNADKVGTSPLSSPHGPRCVLGRLGRGKTEGAWGSMRREKRGSSLFPSSTARLLLFFQLLLFLM